MSFQPITSAVHALLPKLTIEMIGVTTDLNVYSYTGDCNKYSVRYGRNYQGSEFFPINCITTNFGAPTVDSREVPMGYAFPECAGCLIKLANTLRTAAEPTTILGKDFRSNLRQAVMPRGPDVDPV